MRKSIPGLLPFASAGKAQAPRSASYQVRQVRRLAGVPAPQWDALVGDDNPFLNHAFLSGLEEHDCLEDHGWLPCHLLVFKAQALVGALPLYLRGNSEGEFVFDWNWAEAYERAGGRYYPKLVTAIPFTPVSGPRFLVRSDAPDADAVRTLLLESVIEFARANRLSSWHCLFPDTAAATWLGSQDLLPRQTCRFHWRNCGYRDFQEFLDALSSKHRKQLRRERRAVAEAGVEIVRLTGREITTRHWEMFHVFYCDTFARHCGQPRFTLPFLRALGDSMPDQTLLILARQRGEWVAGAFAMQGARTLFGRHWGCSRDIPFLHFELCYHQTIEHCIQSKLSSVDAGVQGEHKLARGFEPVAAPSFHWLRDPGFRAAVGDYLIRERAQVRQYAAALHAHLPYRGVPLP
ncbi:MAG: N-acetyltransferase [Gammaproteobacteria bacterium]|nr:N-acetyltransferase [Gammaproteobacteria bacterium]